jgi:3-hydroxyisobutyrate dehydrogenase-like beta-hydroxyacid dehydrogenase
MESPVPGETSVAVIGLGRMGSAIARAVLAAGYRVTIWNRSPGRAALLRGAGPAVMADSPAEAISDSSLIVMCVSDHTATQSILDSSEFAESLKGKTLVQLTSLTPDQVRAQQEWVHQRGGLFIAGGIMCYPSSIGRPEAVIFLGGDAVAWQRHRSVVAAVAGSARFLDEDPGVPVAAYMTAGVLGVATLGLFYETAALAHHYGIPISTYFGLARTGLDLARDRIRDSAHRIATGNYVDDDDSIDMLLEGLHAYCAEFERIGVPVPMIKGLRAQCELASKDGRGGQEAACVVEALLARRNSAANI